MIPPSFSIIRRLGRLVIFVATTSFCLVAGAQDDPLERAADEAARVAGRDGLAAGSRVAERLYSVAKYGASARQRIAAIQQGQKASRKHGTKSRYLAVPTTQDGRSKGPVSVMVWDTKSRDVVGNNVYDLNVSPTATSGVELDGVKAVFVAR